MANNYDPKIKEIKPGSYESLSICQDYDTNPDLVYPVFLFTPDIKEFEHYHIELSREQAIVLRDWLNEYLEQ